MSWSSETDSISIRRKIHKCTQGYANVSICVLSDFLYAKSNQYFEDEDIWGLINESGGNKLSACGKRWNDVRLEGGPIVID